MTPGAAVLGLASTGGIAQQAPDLRPNIVFVFSDEHRWCSLPFTEAPEVVTPALRRLSSQGTSFNHCISNNPVCVPYRGMLLTGRWPFDSGFISNDFAADDRLESCKGRRTIAHTFKQAGYTTGYVGKWHLVEEAVYYAGFDYHKHWLFGDDHWETPYRDVPSREPYKTYTNYNAVGMTDQALEFIRAQSGRRQPFLLMLSLNPPHYRWDDAPPECLRLYPEENLVRRLNVSGAGLRQAKRREEYRHYLAHISAVDREMGRIMDALDERGLSDNTVLIYSSDHGSMFDSHGLFSKPGAPYDETHRVPFIARWPGRIPADRRTDTLLGAIDIYPTLCGLASVPVPAWCGGSDLSRVVLGDAAPPRKSQFIFHAHDTNWSLRAHLNPQAPNWHPFYRGVRTERYTYAVYADGEWGLFDNQKDPLQKINLKDDPAYAAVKTELRCELEAWLKRAEDPFIPEPLRARPLPERIREVGAYATRLHLAARWEAYKERLAHRFEKGDVSAARRRRIREACAQIVTWDVFFMLQALNLQIKSESEKPGRDAIVAEARKKAEALEYALSDQLNAVAQSAM